MKRLIVFDLDGTLIDSRRDLADAANALIVERGGEPLSVEAIANMVGEGAALLVRRALAASGSRPNLRKDLLRFLELYDERLLNHTRLYDGTVEMLEMLHRVSTLAVLTNKPQAPSERILEGLGIARYFTYVVGGDTPHGRKPDPSGLRELMQATGTSQADTIMIGDSVIDLRTARAAGTCCCLVRYGFGFPTAAPETDGTDLIVDSPLQVVAATTG
jgi:phosphoglycolate phosphatase